MVVSMLTPPAPPLLSLSPLSGWLLSASWQCGLEFRKIFRPFMNRIMKLVLCWFRFFNVVQLIDTHTGVHFIAK